MTESLDLNGYVALGKILKNPHVLIAGTTGSGKSTLIDNFIWTIAANSKECGEMILIDPKRVDLYKWRNLPHVLRYETEVDGAISALDFAIAKMEARYKDRHEQSYWRNLYVIVDELADLMVTAKKQVMPRLQRIAQLGRGANIHLICATQAPSRKVIPAELTLNFTDRIALRCVSAIESKQIIGEAGAEDLPRYGKALYSSSEGLFYLPITLTPKEEIQARIDYWEERKPKGFLQTLFGR